MRFFYILTIVLFTLSMPVLGQNRPLEYDKKQLLDHPKLLKLDIFKPLQSYGKIQLGYEHPMADNQALSTEVYYGFHTDNSIFNRYDITSVNGAGLIARYKYYRRLSYNNHNRSYFAMGGAFRYTDVGFSEITNVYFDNSYAYGKESNNYESSFSIGYNVSFGMQFRLSKRLELETGVGLELRKVFKENTERSLDIYDLHLQRTLVGVLFDLKLCYLWN